MGFRQFEGAESRVGLEDFACVVECTKEKQGPCFIQTILNFTGKYKSEPCNASN